MFRQMTWWRAEGNHSWMYAFTCFPCCLRFCFFPNSCKLTPKSLGGELFSLTVALSFRSGSPEENKSAIGLLLLHLLQNLPMVLWRSLIMKACVASSYQPNSIWKVQVTHSQPPPNLFNSVLDVQSGNFKNSIWRSWTVMQLWWTYRSRCIWDLLACNMHRIFLDIDLKKKSKGLFEQK